MNNENVIKFNIDFRYSGEKTNALKKVEGSVNRGQCIVLCGGSGCGKSTLLRCFNRLIPEFYEGKLKGCCIMNGKNLDGVSIGEVSESAASVFQDPRSQFFTVNSSTEVAFGLENFGYSQEEIVKRVDNTFKQLKLEKLRNRNVFDLSSGERQLVAILSATAMNPDVFLLDEPTANLDFAAIEQLRELLLFLKSRNKTILINEHRLYYLNGLADEYWVMHDGEITEVLSGESMNKLTEFQLSERCLRVTNLDKIEPADKECFYPCDNADCLSAEHISFGYGKHQLILNDISFDVSQGEVVGLIGSNGSGKTTFGKLITGLYSTNSGEFRFNGEPVDSKGLLQKGLFILQEAEFQFFTNSVKEELRYGRYVDNEQEELFESLLKEFNLWECRGRHPFSLSGGQMQKLSLILAYLSDKPIVVLDEPTSGLDYQSLKSCIDLIKKMKRTKIVFIITHDLELISQVCTRCIFISEGKVGKAFDLTKKSNFFELKNYMLKSIRLTDNQRCDVQVNTKSVCDPRVKLLYLAVTLVVAATADTVTMILLSTLLVIFALVNRCVKPAVTIGLVLAVIFTLAHFTTGAVIMFISNFLPRFLLMGLVLPTVFSGEGVSELIAALRKLRVPEKAIMICSVVFRFFPVLQKDMKIMSQSIKTRGFFKNISEKIRNLPEYLEIMIVPMVFRVIRIAEALSASAETRGINLKRKKNSYIALKLSWIDGLMTVFMGVFVALSFAL